MPAFALRLRDARLSTGRTLRGLSKVTGFSPQFLSEVELGKRLVSRPTLDRLLGAYLLERAHQVDRPAIVRGWLEERCRQDRVLGRALGALTFMQHCRRRRIERGLSMAAVERRAGVSTLGMREHGRRLPPRRAAALRLLRVLRLPPEFVRLAEQERVQHRRRLFLPAGAA
jgi:transcriptional regulator with XRE-family HTH domain